MIPVRQGRQPLHVHAQEPGESLRFGLAQLRELGGDALDGAMPLT